MLKKYTTSETEKIFVPKFSNAVINAALSTTEANQLYLIILAKLDI